MPFACVLLIFQIHHASQEGLPQATERTQETEGSHEEEGRKREEEGKKEIERMKKEEERVLRN